MSAKTTTMNNSNNNNSATSATGTNSAAANTATVAGVKIKKEIPSSDEIKEFAENTMNELLGWYGFDGVDRLDLSAKTSRLLQTAAVAAAAAAADNIANNNNNSSVNSNNNRNTNAERMSQQQHHHLHHQHHMEKRRSRSSRGSVTLQQLQQQRGAHMRNITNNNNNSSNNNNIMTNINRKGIINSNSSSGGVGVGGSNNYRNNRSSCNVGGVNSVSLLGIAGATTASTLGTGNESTNSDHETRSSREDDSKSPLSAGKNGIMDEKSDNQNCCWCRRPVPENAPDFLTTTDGPRYCSESCFTQSRRASFKKAKTCDWCKHVRHAVSYVDFQDGASQLQFCSDKCLNQYKMQIFCKETQAHLDMNPHLREQGIEAAAASNGAGLITPELWLRNCRSRSASPASTISVSPGPPVISLSPPPRDLTPNSSYANHTGTTAVAATKTIFAPTVQIQKPIISVAPVSKLMSKSPGIMQHRQSPKHSRKKRPLRTATVNTELTSSILKSSQPATTHDLVGNVCTNKTKTLLSSGGGGGSGNSSLCTSPGGHLMAANVKPITPTLSQFAGSSVQDLHMSVPPLSPPLQPPVTTMLDQQTSHFPLQPHGHHITNGGRVTTPIPATNLQHPFFATPTVAALPPPPAGFPLRTPFLTGPAAGLIPPRFLGAAPMPPMFPPDISSLGALLGAQPPVTVMVPYPIILPLPIPIPVPLPLIEFHKAYLTTEEREKLKQLQQIEQQTVSTANEPLDCTKVKNTDDNQAERINATAATEADMRPQTPAILQLNNDEVVSPTSIMQTATTGNEAVEDDATTGSPVEVTHCIVTATPPLEANDINNETDANATEDEQQKLPKFKITRLQTKRTLMLQTKESECSRPLRKRKRIIDCDFQKMALKEAEEHDEQNEAATSSTNTTIETTAVQATQEQEQQQEHTSSTKLKK